jgi:hypothetical protein
VDRARRRGQGHAPARRLHRRGDSGQHRHRPRAGRQRARLQDDHRHAREPVEGEDGHAARARRRAGPRSRRPSSPTQATSSTPRAGSPRRPKARCGPTSSTTSPTARPTSRAPRPSCGSRWTGRIDGFTCAVGTGGTLAGVGLGLKEFDETVTIALTDPHGAALYNYYANGELLAEGSSVAEGIGQGRITANLEGAPIDTQFRISDEEGLYWVARLLKEEGLCLGLSSGINVAGAVALGKQLAAEGGEGKRVATILCDTGFRYLSSLYNREWLEEKGLPVFDWLG